MREPPQRRTTATEALGALALCFLAACLFTWPLVTDLAGSTLAGRFQLSHAWAMETVSDGLRGASPHVRMWLDPTPEQTPWSRQRSGLVIHTTAINWPGGGEIVFLAWFNLLLGSALRAFLPYLSAFNLSVLTVLALAPWSAWLLARRLGASRGAAALAGLTYGCSPYLLGVVHNGQLAKYNHAWIALLVLLTWELTDRGRRAWIALPLAWLIGTIALGSSPYLFLFGGLGCGLLAAWRLGQPSTWAQRGLALLRLVLAAAGGLLLARPLIQHFAAREASMLSPSTPGEDTAAREIAASLSNLLLPLGCPVPPALPQTDELHIAYLGLAGLALALGGTLLSRQRHRLLPWWLLVLTFSTLAMGRGSEPLPLPLGWIITVLPEGRALAFVYRAVAVASLGLAVLVALGADSLTRRWPRHRRTLLATASTLLLADTLLLAPAPWPLAVQRIELPPAWGSLAREPGPFGVLAWPVDHAALDGLPDARRDRIQALTQELVLYQGWHDQGLGFVDKGNHTRDSYQTGLMQGLSRLARGLEPDPELSIPRSVRWLQKRRFRYLVLHPDELPEATRQPTLRWLEAVLGPPRRWEGSDVLRWRLALPVEQEAPGEGSGEEGAEPR